MWIDHSQIGEALHEQDLCRQRNRVAGNAVTHVTIDGYGCPINQYVAGGCENKGLTTEQSIATLKQRRKMLHDNKMKDRISVEEWNRMATI